jgi:hypothetical protein
LVDQGDPSTATLPTTCAAGGSVLNLFAEPPTVACNGCACSASCSTPSLNCFTDSNCTQGQKTVSPSGGCYDSGQTFQSFSLSAPPTVTSCDATGGEAQADYHFGKFLSFCADPTCVACEPPSAGQACVAAAGIIPQCPDGLDQQILVYGDGVASCPTCGCEATCDAPFNVKHYLDAFCVAGGQSIATTGCTSSNDKRYVTSDAGSASCTTGPSGDHAGSFTTSDPYTVCCRSALPPPG